MCKINIIFLQFKYGLEKFKVIILAKTNLSGMLRKHKIIYFSNWGFPRSSWDRLDFLLETLSKKYLILECGCWDSKSLFKIDLKILEANGNSLRIRVLIPRTLSLLDKLFRL